MMKLENTVHDIAIDFHDVPFYGDKNTPGIRGNKTKEWQFMGKSFCTLDIIGISHLTLDVIDINSFNKNYSLFIESLFERLKTIGVKTGTAYLDKEFCNRAVISKLDELKVNFVIAAKSNQVINRELKNHQKEWGILQLFLNINLSKEDLPSILWQYMMIKGKGTSCLLQTKRQNQLRNLKRQFLKNTEKDGT